MQRLALRFLGPPQVSLDGNPIEIRRRKVLALLAHLAVTAQPHSRDALAALLFGELDRQHARADLRQCLSLLGSAIGAAFISSDRAAVRLVAGRSLWTDVAEYRRLLRKAHAADRDGRADLACDSLERAAALFRGEFLSGFFLRDAPDFEAWQLQEEEGLHAQQASTLRRLVEIHSADRRYEQAINCARRWLALDSLDESVHRELMRLYGLCGRRAEALRQYRVCREALQRELDETPAEETERMRRAIESRKPVPGGQSTPNAIAGSTPLSPDASPPPSLFLFVQSGPQEEESLDAMFRAAVGRTNGRVVVPGGSVRCAAFLTARDAAAAVLRLHSGALPPGPALRCILAAEESRAASESPSEELAEKASLILEAARAGQVLLTDAAARVCEAGALPGGVTLRGLGVHRLRNLGSAVRVHQMEHRALPRARAALAGLDGRPNNLPTQPTAFIGREEDLAAVQALMSAEDVRLVTLAGVGGSGKTRLALQAAAALCAHFEHGAFFVDLSPVRDPAQVTSAIASALGIREVGGDARPLLETLQGWLRSRELLLVLDNFEQVEAAAADAASLLAGCPGLKILATSREPLHVRAERIHPVLPMRLPSPGQGPRQMERSDAVRLFVRRAAAASPGFALTDENAAAVAEICIRADGLPLALELAAARMSVLSPREMLQKLENRLHGLAEGPADLPARQRALRSEIDWSHELLDVADRRLFRRLSVFCGGCTLEGAEDVCRVAGEDVEALPRLCSLADKSLLMRAEAGGEPRYRMLESIREYARERLVQSGEAGEVEKRFCAHLLALAERAEPLLYGPEQREWLERIETEYDNFRAALSMLRDRGARQEGIRLAGALGWFWFRRGRFTEGAQWLQLFRSAAEESDPPGPRAKAAYYLGWMTLCVGRAFWGNPEGRRFFEESLALWRSAGNNEGIALSEVWLGWQYGGEEGEEGWALADEAVATARGTGNPWAIAWCLKIAWSHLRRRDHDLAARRAALAEAIALARETGDPFLVCQTTSGMGNVLAWSGELAEAEPWYREALEVARSLDDDWCLMDTLNVCADAFLGLGRLEAARRLFSEGLQAAAELGARGYLGWFIGGLYGVARREGRLTRAARLGAASEAILGAAGPCDPGFARELGLDPQTAAVEWEKGRSMTVEQAVAYALADE